MDRAATWPSDSSLDSMRAGCGSDGMSSDGGRVAPVHAKDFLVRHSHREHAGDRATRDTKVPDIQ